MLKGTLGNGSMFISSSQKSRIITQQIKFFTDSQSSLVCKIALHCHALIHWNAANLWPGSSQQQINLTRQRINLNLSTEHENRFFYFYVTSIMPLRGLISPGMQFVQFLSNFDLFKSNYTQMRRNSSFLDTVESLTDCKFAAAAPCRGRRQLLLVC